MLLSKLVYALVRLLDRTYRFEHVGAEHLASARALGNNSFVLGIWHQNLFAGILARARECRHIVIVSRSRDGDPVAYLCQRFGTLVARGSSKRGGRDKGGKDAKDEMIEVLRTGVPGAVTIDGPKGPAHVVKPGIIEMARQAGVPIVPYLALANRYWSFPSWDRFRVPKPFAHIKACYGAPIPVPPGTTFADFPAIQQRIVEALDALERAQA